MAPSAGASRRDKTFNIPTIKNYTNTTLASGRFLVTEVTDRFRHSNGAVTGDELFFCFLKSMFSLHWFVLNHGRG